MKRFMAVLCIGMGISSAAAQPTLVGDSVNFRGFGPFVNPNPITAIVSGEPGQHETLFGGASINDFQIVTDIRESSILFWTRSSGMSIGTFEAIEISDLDWSTPQKIVDFTLEVNNRIEPYRFVNGDGLTRGDVSFTDDSVRIDLFGQVWSSSGLATLTLITEPLVPELGSDPSNPILPITNGGQACAGGDCFAFSAQVTPGGLGDDMPLFIDPVVAVGYQYDILTDDTFFQSVIIPAGNGLSDGDTLRLLAGGSEFSIFVGTEFDLQSAGLTDLAQFTILGIDPELGLDPNDPLAFVTGLTFAGPVGSPFASATTVEVTMTPIAIPEPAGVVMLMAALAGIACCRR